MSRLLPEQPNLEHLKNQAKDLLRAVERGEPRETELFRSLLTPPVPAKPQLADAQHAIARDYGFSTWAELKHYVERRTDDSGGVAELVTAIKTDDVERAARALAEHPGLKRRLDDPVPGFSFGATPLIAALPSANQRMIDLLLDSGANINQRSHWWAGSFGVLDHDNPLTDHLIARGARIDVHAAARLGKLDVLERLVREQPDRVHARGGDGQTPLHFAGSVEIARWLLDHGADLDALDVDHESTPAQYLVRDHQDVARLLVSRGCRTDLLMAAALGDLELARRHLDANPECIRMTVSDEWFPRRNPHSGGSIYFWKLGHFKSAHLIAREFEHQDVLALLLERSPDSLKLALACELGDEALFQRMLAERPGLATRLSEDEKRKLANAAQNNNASAVRLMLDAGWPTDSRGQHGGTALHWAAWHGNLEMARAILRHHPALELRDEAYDGTALGWALHGSEQGWHREKGDYAAVVEALLDAGANAPPLTGRVVGSETALEVLRRRARC